jgi:hypothetical protein
MRSANACRRGEVAGRHEDALRRVAFLYRPRELADLINSDYVARRVPLGLDVDEVEPERIHVDDAAVAATADPLARRGVGAVEDALAPFEAVIRSLPITPERVWRLMREAR